MGDKARLRTMVPGEELVIQGLRSLGKGIRVLGHLGCKSGSLVFGDASGHHDMRQI